MHTHTQTHTDTHRHTQTHTHRGAIYFEGFVTLLFNYKSCLHAPNLPLEQTIIPSNRQRIQQNTSAVFVSFVCLSRIFTVKIFCFLAQFCAIFTAEKDQKSEVFKAIVISSWQGFGTCLGIQRI